jgi:hypothetical protein
MSSIFSNLQYFPTNHEKDYLTPLTKPNEKADISETIIFVEKWDSRTSKGLKTSEKLQIILGT